MSQKVCRNCGQPIIHVETFAASITDFDWVHVPSYANECHLYTTAEPDNSSKETP